MIKTSYTTIISPETYHDWIAVSAYYTFLERIERERFDPPPAVGALRDWDHGVQAINEYMRENSITIGIW